MTLESVVRVVATCDRCGQVARAGEQVVQWVDEEAALRDLSGPVMGWIACSQTQICGGCVGAVGVRQPGARVGGVGAGAGGVGTAGRDQPGDPGLWPVRA